MIVVATNCCCEIFSSALLRDLSSSRNLYSQAGSSSSFGIHPRPLGPRSVSGRQNESVVRGMVQTQRFPHPQPLLPNQPYQQPQVPQQRFPPWLSKTYSTQHRQIQPLLPLPTTAVRSSYQSDSVMAAKTAGTSALMASGRGRGGSQHVAARPPVPLISPRTAEKTSEMRKQLLDVFPDNAKQVDSVLQQNRCICNVDDLCLKVSELV